MSRIAESRLQPIDYDLHGVVGIRLLDATPADARAVARQLGPLRRNLERDPDLVIRFVDDLRPSAPLRYLGVDEAAFTDDGFYVLPSKHRSRARARIPFEQIGGRCEIVCESGLPAVPLLIPILNLSALARGLAPLHASAFRFRGTGVLVTGWSKGGKTEALLAFMSKGAEYLGDEWIYVAADTKQMHGIPQPIRLWDWHLKQFEEYRERLEWGDRARLGTLQAALGISRGVMRRLNGHSKSARAFGRLRALMERQTYVDLPSERLFGPCRSLAGPIDRLFLTGSGAQPRIVVEPIDGSEVVRRMVYSVSYELQKFHSYYLMYQFAFPGAKNEWIEAAEDHLRAALCRGLQGKPSYAVHHPYPMSLAALFEAMSPLV
jgi:hypothetical protein